MNEGTVQKCTFEYLITITPFGHLYGSSGSFLSPENLVGRSREKFPPDGSTIAGLILNAYQHEQKSSIARDLHVLGGFWANQDTPADFFVPLPRTKIVADEDWNEWQLDAEGSWCKQQDNEVEPEYNWVNIESWDETAEILHSNQLHSTGSDDLGVVAKSPWKFVPMLHPRLQKQSRNVMPNDGLFLEQAVQLPENICLVYLASHEVSDGCYRFGGENHFVDLHCQPLPDYRQETFKQEIDQSFALITNGIWGSNRFSRRFPDPKHTDFREPTHLLTDKPIPLRSRGKGVLQRGRYGVPAGSVYILPEALDRAWQNWSKEWFPTSGYSLKQVGYGAALPLTIAQL